MNGFVFSFFSHLMTAVIFTRTFVAISGAQIRSGTRFAGHCSSNQRERAECSRYKLSDV